LKIHYIKSLEREHRNCLTMSHEFALVGCGSGEVAIKNVARGEMVMRVDFSENHFTFPGDLDIPLGSSEHL